MRAQQVRKQGEDAGAGASMMLGHRTAGRLHHSSRVFLLILAFLALPTLARDVAASKVITPAVGSTERTAVLDAARVPIEAELGVPIRFVIEQIRVVDDWAFVLGRPVGVDGKPVDYSATPYAEAIEEGMFEDSAVVLLQRKAGDWDAVTHVIGATDVPWIGWDTEFGASAAVFPPSD